MPKTKISEFSATPANNTDIDSINIAEGCAPSGINDAIRELMAQLKDFQTGAVGDSFNGPIGTTTAAAGAFTTLSSTGNTTLGDASGDAVTINGTATFANANPTLTAGTANGVTYLNGSKVLTSGSALTFNGTNLSIGNSGLTGDRNVSMVNSTGNSTFGTYGGSGYGSLTSGDAYAYTSKNIVLMADDAAASIKFSAGGSAEGMRLTSTGLGIGLTNPAQKLDVNGNIRLVGNIGTNQQTLSAWTANNRAFQPTTYGAISSNNSVGNVSLSTNAYESSDSAWKRVAGTSAGLYQISYTGAHSWYYTGGGSADSAISWTQMLAVDGGKSLALEGATSQTGAGITFPATQSASSNANTLDDYEEGTWTPTDASGASLSFTVSFANYTKVGRLVTVSTRFEFPTTVSTADILISGLPFAGTSDTAGAPIYTMYTEQTGMLFVGSSQFRIYNASFVRLTNINLTGKSIILNASYTV